MLATNYPPTRTTSTDASGRLTPTTPRPGRSSSSNADAELSGWCGATACRSPHGSSRDGPTNRNHKGPEAIRYRPQREEGHCPNGRWPSWMTAATSRGDGCRPGLVRNPDAAADGRCPAEHPPVKGGEILGHVAEASRRKISGATREARIRPFCFSPHDLRGLSRSSILTTGEDYPGNSAVFDGAVLALHGLWVLGHMEG